MRAILAALAGAVVLFVWGAAFWMGLANVFGGLRQLEPEKEAAIVGALQAQDLQTGVYYFPGQPTHGRDLAADEAKRLTDEWTARHEAGPLGMLTYVAQGKPVMDPVYFVRGFLIDLIACILVCMLVLAATPGGFIKRWSIVLVFGLAVATSVHLVNWNWMFIPSDYTLMACVDTIIGWTLAGFVIAALVPSHKRRKAG